MSLEQDFDNLLEKSYAALNLVSMERKWLGVERLALTGEWEVILDKLDTEDATWFTQNLELIAEGVLHWLDYLSETHDPTPENILLIDELRLDIENYLEIEPLKSKDEVDQTRYSLDMSREFTKTIIHRNKQSQLNYIHQLNYDEKNDSLVQKDSYVWLNLDSYEYQDG